MKKIILILFIIILAGFGIYCFQSSEQITAPNKPTIKIGVSLPLSGDVSAVGEVTKIGMQMLLDRAKQKDLKYDYQLFFENNESSPMKTATTTNKLIFSDKVNAIVSIWNPMSGIIANITSPQKIVSVVCSWEDDSLITPYTFNIMPTNEQLVDLLVEELKNNKIKSVAIMSDSSGQYFIEIMKNKLALADIKIVFNEMANLGHNDFKMEIIKANKQNPDMYIISGYPPLPFIFTKQLEEITGRKNITTIDGFEDMGDDQRQIVNGLWYVDSNVNGNEQFAQDLIKEKGVETQSCTGNAAAGLEVLIEAYENAPTQEGMIPDGDTIANYIRTRINNFETVAGPVSIKGENNLNVPPKVKIVEDGKTKFRH